MAETYGPSVIPNILYMTRVSRNPESGFNYVLGVGLKQLTQECMDHYRARFSDGWPSQPSLCLDPTSGACLFDRPLRDEVTFAIAVRGPLEALLAGVFLLAKPAWASAAVLSGYYASTYLTLVGSYDARDPFGGPSGTPLELGTGLQGVFGEFTVSAGAAFGLTPAPGSSAVRGVLSVQWAPRFLDDDRDGLRDDPSVDHCIGLREDFDGFEDGDGCPDDDNDGDGFADKGDKCPDDPETVNGVDDDDGCPDVRTQTGPVEAGDRIDLRGNKIEFTGSAGLTP